MPWSCAVDIDTAILSCTPAYLAVTRTLGERFTCKSPELNKLPVNLTAESTILNCTPHALLMPSDFYLSYIWQAELVPLVADSCSLLDIFGGSFTGPECGLLKQFGRPETNVFGNQNSTYQVTPTFLLGAEVFAQMKEVPYPACFSV